MADKVTLSNFSTFTNDSSAVATINNNNQLLTSAFDNTLSRDGTVPNQMGAQLDMNSNQIINLGAPASGTSAARLQDVITGTGTVTINNSYTSATLVDSPAPSGGDDTTALNGWISTIQGTGQIGLLRPGTFLLQTAALSITGAVTIIGSGMGTSIIQPVDTINGITILTTSTVNLSNFSIVYANASPGNSGTYGIHRSCSSTQSLNDRFSNIEIGNAYVGMYLNACDLPVISGCWIHNTASDGLQIANTNNADIGDQCVSNCAIGAIGNPAGSTSSAIFYTGGGGLKVINSKVGYGYTGKGIFLDLASGSVTGDLLVDNCSMEGIGLTSSAVFVAATGPYAITLQRSAATGSWINAMVNNVETDGTSLLVVPTDANGTWITNITASNNTMFSNGTTACVMYSIDSTNNVSLIGGAAHSNGNAANQIFGMGSGVSSGVIGGVARYGTWAADSNSGTNVRSIDVLSGDGSINGVGALTVTKSAGSAFGTAAFQNTGTSGANVPLLNAHNNFSGFQGFGFANTGAAVAAFQNTNGASGDLGIQIGVGPAGADTASYVAIFYNGGITTSIGNIARNGTNSVAYNVSSDARLKNEKGPSSKGLEDLLKVKVKDFSWKSDPDHVHNGIFAQELKEVYPEAVDTGNDEKNIPWSIDYGRITPLLIQSIQDLHEELKSVRATKTTEP